MVKRWIIIQLLLLWSLVPAMAWDKRNGARPLGMGDAFVALADDLNTMNYNPAGLAIEKNLEAIFEYANLYPGLDDGSVQENYIAYAQNLYHGGGFGLTWNNRAISGAYTENELMAGYAFQPSLSLPMYIGLTGKLFYIAYTDESSRVGNDFFDDGFEKWQWGLDVGLLGEIMPETQVTPGLRLGLSVLNVNQPDIGLHSVTQQPMDMRAGIGAVWGEWDGAVDVRLKDSEFQIHAGAEKWFHNREWGVRAGVISGAGTETTVTMGGSYTFDVNVLKLRCDYCFNYSFGGIQETYGIQRISLNLLHPLPSIEELKKIKKERQQQKKLAHEQLRAQAYKTIEKTRTAIVQIEKIATSASDKEKIKIYREEAQKAYNLVSQEKYQTSINIMEKIQKACSELGEKINENSQLKQEKKMKRAELIQRVKKYLIQKILQYGSIRQKTKRLRKEVDQRYERDIYRIEQILFEGRNELVKKRNLRGFLKKLDEANKEMLKVEQRIENEALVGY